MIRRRPIVPTETWPAGLVARFVTLGGAAVDLRHKRWFYDRSVPLKTAKSNVVEGFNWECKGCGAYGYEGTACYTSTGYLDERDARSDANAHASTCRATTRPAIISIRAHIAEQTAEHEQWLRQIGAHR